MCVFFRVLRVNLLTPKYKSKKQASFSKQQLNSEPCKLFYMKIKLQMSENKGPRKRFRLKRDEAGNFGNYTRQSLVIYTSPSI
jgi:hypothetical protein